jgi:hypothetical protein
LKNLDLKKMAQELLREFYELCEGGVCQDLLTEDEKLYVTTGGLMLTGIMQKANQENGNGRIYSRKILQREIDNYQKIIIDRRALGELDHPDDSVVNLKNVSHMVTKMWWEGDNVMGKVKVLETPSGNILKSLVKSGVKLGISSRGLGSTRKEGGKIIVEEDFQLICFDFVQEPSTPGAFMMKEGKRRDFNQVFNKADTLNRLLNDIIGK